jgi:hypothetical protein
MIANLSFNPLMPLNMMVVVIPLVPAGSFEVVNFAMNMIEIAQQLPNAPKIMQATQEQLANKQP